MLLIALLFQVASAVPTPLPSPFMPPKPPPPQAIKRVAPSVIAGPGLPMKSAAIPSPGLTPVKKP